MSWPSDGFCFAAYKIKARRFEFSTEVWKVASFKITVISDEGPALPTHKIKP